MLPATSCPLRRVYAAAALRKKSRTPVRRYALGHHHHGILVTTYQALAISKTTQKIELLDPRIVRIQSAILLKPVVLNSRIVQTKLASLESLKASDWVAAAARLQSSATFKRAAFSTSVDATCAWSRQIRSNVRNSLRALTQNSPSSVGNRDSRNSIRLVEHRAMHCLPRLVLWNHRNRLRIFPEASVRHNWRLKRLNGWGHFCPSH